MTDFRIERTERGFHYWRSRPFVGEELGRQLSQASVLLVPKERFRDLTEPVFPAGTEEFLDHLRNTIPTQVGTDICIEEEQYREVALHSDLWILADVVVTSLACNLIASAIHDYLKDRLGSRAERTNVRFQMTIEHDMGEVRKAATISYEGPVSGFEELLKTAISKAQEEIGGQCGRGTSSSCDKEDA